MEYTGGKLQSRIQEQNIENIVYANYKSGSAGIFEMPKMTVILSSKKQLCTQKSCAYSCQISRLSQSDLRSLYSKRVFIGVISEDKSLSFKTDHSSLLKL